MRPKKHNANVVCGKWRSAVPICLAFIFSAGLLPGGMQDASPDRPFTISARSDVDENLFALRLLANLYATWPDLRNDRDKVSKWFSGARTLGSEMRGQIAARRLDADLDLAFQSTLNYLSATETYLSALDIIDQRASTQNAIDIFSSAYKGLKDGSDAKDVAKKLNMSDENVSNAGGIVGLASGIADYANLSKQRSNATKAAIADEERKLQDLWTSTSSTLRSVSRTLSMRYGWRPGEGGFDGFQSPRATELVEHYPRDPFIKAQQADSLITANSTPSDYQQSAYLYLQAAELVPADTGYDRFRSSFVSGAVDYAVSAASLQAGRSGYSSAPSAGTYALKVARTYLSMFPQDSNAWGRVELARALAFSGRYEEAINTASAAYSANKDWAADAGFCTRYAALLSLTRRSNSVSEWLSQAFKDGYSDVSYLRQSPDFANFRYSQPREFATLTTVQWAWKVDFGVFNDDVVVFNKSAFDLTNVVVNVRIRKGSQEWNRQFKCSSITRGDSCKAENIISIPGSAYDEGVAGLNSDQGSGQ